MKYCVLINLPFMVHLDKKLQVMQCNLACKFRQRMVKNQCITKSPNNDWASSLCSQIIGVHIKISHFNPLSDVGKLE